MYLAAAQATKKAPIVFTLDAQFQFLDVQSSACPQQTMPAKFNSVATGLRSAISVTVASTPDTSIRELDARHGNPNLRLGRADIEVH